jgi:hypothetical protein
MTTRQRPNAAAYAKGLVDYHGKQEASDIARLMLAAHDGDAFRVEVDTRHKGVFGDRDYWMRRIDMTLCAAEWDATTVMLQAVVARIGPLLAGDMLRVRVTRSNDRGESRVTYRWRGKPERDTFDHVSDRQLTDWP